MLGEDVRVAVNPDVILQMPPHGSLEFSDGVGVDGLKATLQSQNHVQDGARFAKGLEVLLELLHPRKSELKKHP
jgi:hypothetical protein